MKSKIKKMLGFLLGNNLSFRLLRIIGRKHLLILYYHRVVKREEAERIKEINMSIDIDSFDAQMRFLNKCYKPIGEQEIIKSLETLTIPNYLVWITFDDGYRDNYLNAYPILKKYGIPATFFVTTGYINNTVKPNEDCDNDIFMNWSEIKEMNNNGFSIGAHTKTHRILSSLSQEEIEKEVLESKNEIEQRIGKQIFSFAYPVGKQKDYDKVKCVPVLKKGSFKVAVTTIGGFNSIRQLENNPLELKRIGLSRGDALRFFKVKLGLGGFWQRK